MVVVVKKGSNDPRQGGSKTSETIIRDLCICAFYGGTPFFSELVVLALMFTHFHWLTVHARLWSIPVFFDIPPTILPQPCTRTSRTSAGTSSSRVVAGIRVAAWVGVPFGFNNKRTRRPCGCGSSVELVASVKRRIHPFLLLLFVNQR